MNRILQSPWVAAAIGVVAYLLTTAWMLRPGVLLSQARSAIPDRRGTSKIESLVPSWAYKNPEIDQLIGQLATERDALRLKEKELNDLASRLALERQEIGIVTQRMASLQAEMDRTFVRIQDDEIANLKRLAKVYATMAPESASKILIEFQDDAAVKILAFMKEAEAAPLLENMAKTGPAAARRVAIISDRLRLLNTSSAKSAAPGTPAPTNPTATPAPPAAAAPAPAAPPASTPPVPHSTSP